MSDDETSNRALLPAGLRDLLPPDAETEASAVEAIMDVFAGHGYQRVKPPLLEFEDSLLGGSGAAGGAQTLRAGGPGRPRGLGPRAHPPPPGGRVARPRASPAPRPSRVF